MAAASGLSGVHSPTTNYIMDRIPNFYGGKQEEYQAFANEAITCGIALLREGVREGKDATALFFELLTTFQEKRHAIAVRHQTKRAEYFGQARARQGVVGGGRAMTGLYAPYEEYNVLFKKQLAPLLAGLRHDAHHFEDKKAKVEERCSGHLVSFGVEVIEGADEIKKATEVLGEKELQEYLKTDKSLEEIQNDLELMRRIKKGRPDWYSRMITCRVLGQIATDFPSPTNLNYEKGTCDGNPGNLKSDWVRGILRVEIGGKMYAISQYITWLYRDFRRDPVERMKMHSHVYVVHQDTFLIDDTLQEISKVFAEAVAWNRESETLLVLKERIALLRFLFAHCMPSARGDGAIGDWLELTLYRYHGFTSTRYAPDTLPCFVALSTLTLSGYLNLYDTTVIVE